MRKKHALVFGLFPLVSIVSIASCVGDGNAVGNGDAGNAGDATNDVGLPDGEAGLPVGATISVTASPTTWVAQNGQSQVAFAVTRNGVTGALTVHANGLPSGVTAADATIADGQNNGTLTLAGSSSSTLGAVANVDIQLLDQTQLEDKKTIAVGVSGPPGTLDTTYGPATLALTNRTIGYTMDIYPASAGANAGKIIVGGVENNSTTDVRLIIARFLPSGQLDTTFGDFTSGDAGARTGYVLFNPGASDDTQITTYPAAVRIDSKGRIVLFNDRFVGSLGPFCDVDLTRWTVDGDLDTTFTRFTGGINGVYCGTAADARFLPNDDVAVVANWNEFEGTESVVQVFSGADGSRQGNGYHVRLDTTGTNANQQTTRTNRMVIDKTSGYVLVGQKCDGGWGGSATTTCSPSIARLTSAGALDTTFGQSSGYTTFAFGTGLSQTFLGAAVDPGTGDIVAAGQNGNGKLGTLARISGAGLPTSFGTGGSLTRDLLGGASSEQLESVMFDSSARIVSVGNAATTQNFVANTRAAASGTADSSYGTGGVNATNPGVAEEAAIGNDDRIYVTGYSGNRLVVWRYWP